MKTAAFVMGNVAAWGVSASTAWAGLTYTSQTRTITAFATAGSVSDQHSASAPDFGLFNQTISASASDPFVGSNAFGSASQNSRLDPLSISIHGTWSGGRSSQAGNPSGGGSTSFSLNFTLDAATDYTFVAEGVMSFMLVGPDGFHISQNGTFAGTLQPGDYGLGGGLSGSTGFPSGGGCTVTLTLVPAPGAAGLMAGGGMVMGRRRRR